MTTPELINKHERLLHALKGKVQVLKNQRWIAINYTETAGRKGPDFLEAIHQTEAEITEHRLKLKSLYETI